MSDIPKYYPLDPCDITENHINFVINSVQPYYFVAESFVNAKETITKYCQGIKQPFKLKYNSKNNSVEIVEGNIIVKS
jgi:Biopterin-dependent aromatic amino acid hydroxylase